ncbi:cadmium-translocating P-type ATPase [Rubellimicrobium rubrum]|uniref:Cadmium-translocating P-type ATPase n=1 Tax=Rubellimicrobium rubrum TaxID=2585369 RepID=A0A5C4MZ11_9RHOB|nr:heavy metal translocating P-type ATPase [Rubellimicrobium rubrum]TNC51483.1 cadmium-translocating P-type ATPase [Rubellimicrobium rubrum]
MSLTEAPGSLGCIGCVTAPAAQGAGAAAAENEIVLAVPGADCAACIPQLEEGLAGFPGVRDVRVNLSLRRLRVRHDGTLAPEDLIPEVAKLGYEALPLDLVALSGTENDRIGRELVMRLGVAFFAMMNVMLLSVAVWSGADDATRDMFHFISGAIAIPTVLFSGQPFFRSAWAGVRRGRLGMDFPISLALVLASSISIYESFNGGHHAYFDAAVMLTFFLLGGRYLDHMTRAAARSAAQELAALEVPRAIRLTADGPETVNVADLAVGDLISVRPGARVPADGVVTDGESEIDRSLLTGESLPARAAQGDAVSAGEVNLTGPLTVRVTAAGRDSSLARMAALVAVAEEARSRYTSLADRAARAYSPLVHTLSFSAFAWWMWKTGGDMRFAINISAATLIITCPCALGLAVPAVVTAASGKLFKKGLLIKSGTALERLAQVDTVVFDKTGTLTLGAPEPLELATHDACDLRVALALAQGSSHPLAQALAKGATALGVRPAHVTDIREVPGHGIEGIWQDTRVRLGRADWVGAQPGCVTATTLRIGGHDPVTFAFADSLRPGAEALVAALARQGMDLHLVSGDVAGAVEGLAQRLGIPSWTAGAKPEEKAAYVKALAAQGRRVLMVGDGLNDTAALAEALVSVSPASALDAARAASDIVLMGRDIAPVEDALRIARQSVRRIRENFWLSAGYNVVSVPIALIGLATPLLAALAMSISSVTVTLNALRLK